LKKVASNSNAAFSRQFSEHINCSLRFSLARSLRDSRVDGETVSVFHQQVSQVTQLRFLPFRLLLQSRIRIRCRFVRCIRPLFTFEINRWVARIVRRITRFFAFFLEALLSCPRLDQRAINGEMLIRQKMLRPGVAEDSLKKALAMSPSSKRSRFLLKTVASQTLSSMLNPTNQRNNRF
jgi:hypothetical protein